MVDPPEGHRGGSDSLQDVGADGRFRFDGLAVGGRVNLAAVHRTEGLVVVAGITLAENETERDVELTLLPGSVVTGIVHDEQGARVAVLDLDAVAQRRSGGGSFSPFSLTGGKVPVTLTAILHTRDGMARFEVQSAEMFGIPVPAKALQELVTYYSRTPERPQGVRLDDAFALPANIQQIEIGQGQAVVVQ